MLSGSLGRKNEEFRGCAYRANIGGFAVRLRGPRGSIEGCCFGLRV